MRTSNVVISTQKIGAVVVAQADGSGTCAIAVFAVFQIYRIVLDQSVVGVSNSSGFVHTHHNRQ